jgi:glycosyltransferase involved in cell wall biosynthesis
MSVVFFHQNQVWGVQGGVERYLSTLLAQAGPSGLLIAEACPRSTAQERANHITVSIPLRRLLPKWLSYSIGVTTAAPRIRRALHRVGPCTLEFSRPEYFLFSWMFTGKKVFTLHGTGPARSNSMTFCLHYLSCLMLPYVADVVQIVGRDKSGLPQVTSAQIANRTRHLDAWYDPVFRVAPFPDTKGPLRIFFAGRLAPMKNPELLFKIVTASSETFDQEFAFQYFGADEEKIPPGQKIASKGLLDARKLAKAIASCHVGILCSRYGEGSPFIVVEALACGRGFILPPLPGLAEAYRGYRGIRFAADYSVDAYVQALVEFQTAIRNGLSPRAIASDVSDRGKEVLTTRILRQLEADRSPAASI